MHEAVPISSVLPVEILDFIFSLLEGSVDPLASPQADKQYVKASLAACALVCRLWQSAVQRHLFKDFKCTLRVRVPHSNRDLLGNTKLDSLVGFMGASPNIAASVRRLELDMAIMREPLLAASGYFAPHDPESCPMRLYKLLRLLPRVEAVKLSNICPFIPPSALKSHLNLPVIPKLESLHIDYGRRADNAVSLYKIAETLRYFGEIRHFELEDVEIVDGDGLFSAYQDVVIETGEVVSLRGRDEIPEYCKFESISFHKVRNASPLLEAFARLPSLRSLKSLQLGCMYSGGCTGLTKLLRTVAGNLQHLQFRADCTINNLNIASLTALTSTTIIFPVIFTIPDSLTDAKVPYTIPNTLPKFLLSAPLSLREVTLVLRPAVGWDPKSLDDLGSTLLVVGSALSQIADRQKLVNVIVKKDEMGGLTSVERSYVSLLLDKLRDRGLLRLD
ncbi:hypothetical protein EIP86_004807 [Pleurotus ostreatoroseus]|nr:hypothetical protein EIP86_004807 [Pleurotus ostreatoroseus]